MSGKYKLEVETYVHATENLDKIVTIIMNLIGGDAPIIIEVMWGHYGDPIFRIYSMITDKNKVVIILTGICKSLINKDYLIKTLPSRIDSKDLYLRFNKQWMVIGKYIIDDGDDVVKLRLRIESDDVLEFIKKVCGV